MPLPRSTPYTVVIRPPVRSYISDRCGRPEGVSDSVLNLSEVFRTAMPVAATTGSTIAAASTPPSPDTRSSRPTALVLLAVQSRSCTGHRLRGHTPYYRHHEQTCDNIMPLSYRKIPACNRTVTRSRRVHSPSGLCVKWPCRVLAAM